MMKLQSVKRLLGNSDDKHGLSGKQPIGRRLFRNGIIALVAVVPIRAAVAQPFYAATNAVAPEVPQGSRVLVFKLDASYQAGNIIVFRQDGSVVLGRVVNHNAASDKVTVSRNDAPSHDIYLSQIVGRVVSNPTCYP